MRVPRSFPAAMAAVTAFVAVVSALFGSCAMAQSDAGMSASPTATENAPGRAYFGGQKFTQTSGQAIYDSVCQACHMPKATGGVGAGAYPSLTHSSKLASGAYVTFMVLNGRNAMPPVGEALDDAQVAAVVNHVRTHFDNHYTDPVTPADVKAARPPASTAAPVAH